MGHGAGQAGPAGRRPSGRKDAGEGLVGRHVSAVRVRGGCVRAGGLSGHGACATTGATAATRVEAGEARA